MFKNEIDTIRNVNLKLTKKKYESVYVNHQSGKAAIKSVNLI